MEIEYAKKYGEILFDYAFDMLFLRETSGVNHAEFIFVRLTEHLQEYAELKGWFLDNVLSTIARESPILAEEKIRPLGFVPEELIEYVAHATKWSEFKQIAQAELQKHKHDTVYLNNRNIPNSVLAALEESWEDIDFYPSLQRREFSF
jgi:hypothetical protein